MEFFLLRLNIMVSSSEIEPNNGKKQLAWIQVYQRYFYWPINSAIVFAIIKLCYIMFCGLGHTKELDSNSLVTQGNQQKIYFSHVDWPTKIYIDMRLV